MIMLILCSTLSGSIVLRVFKHLAQMKCLSLLFHGQVSKAQYG